MKLEDLEFNDPDHSAPAHFSEANLGFVVFVDPEQDSSLDDEEKFLERPGYTHPSAIQRPLSVPQEIASSYKATANYLVDQLRLGTPGATEALHPLVRAAILPYLSKNQFKGVEVEDLLQEAIIRVFEKIDSYKSGTNFYSWVVTIARNMGINYYRKHTRTGDTVYLDAAPISFEYALQGALEEARVNTESGMANQEKIEDIVSDRAILERALREIPANYAIAFLLRTEGMSYAEIAEDLDVPLGTVMSRIHRARKALMDNKEVVELNRARRTVSDVE